MDPSYSELMNIPSLTRGAGTAPDRTVAYSQVSSVPSRLFEDARRRSCPKYRIPESCAEGCIECCVGYIRPLVDGQIRRQGVCRTKACS